MIKEQIFINEGEIYKEVKAFEGVVDDPYLQDLENDPILPFFKETSDGRKDYKSSPAFIKWMLNKDAGVDLSSYDLCPDVTMWLGVATYSENQNRNELFFRADSTLLLQEVASYYNLPYPISTEMGDTLDNNIGTISSYWNNSEDIVIASIKFDNNLPSLFKMYATYKHTGKWDIFNKGRVFVNGNVVEEGAWMVSQEKTKFESESVNTKTVFKATNNEDPINQWEAHRTNLATNETKIEHYESSNMLRKIIGNLDTGSNYEDYDRAPNVNWWLGRSWIENEYEELYFLVEDKGMLDVVANYYNLPVPYDPALEIVLDTNLQSIRFKSYDLNSEGEGNYVAVVVASVTFVNDTATTLKLYETTRWNE